MNISRRTRRGQVLFLEFMISLPIFVILIITMTTFHKFYMGTLAAGQDARRLAWIASQEEIHGKPYRVRDTKTADLNEALKNVAGKRGGIRARIGVRTKAGIGSRNVVAPYFLGDSEALNRVQVTQDAWPFQEVRARSLETRDDEGREINPIQRTIPPPTVNEGKVPDEGYSKPDWSLLHGQSSDPVMQKYRERAPLPAGRDEPGDSAASVLYGDTFAGDMSGYIEL